MVIQGIQKREAKDLDLSLRGSPGKEEPAKKAEQVGQLKQNKKMWYHRKEEKKKK